MRYRMRLAAMAVTGAVALLATACGGSANPQTASNTGETGYQAYVACLSQNGVTLATRSPGAFPSGGPSGRPTDRPNGQPSGGGDGGGPGGFGGGGGGFGGAFGEQAPAGVDQATWEKAQKACESVRPTGGPNGGANNTALTAYRNCLTEHGVTMSQGPGQLNTADAKVAAAVKACEALRPTGRPTQSRPATTPTPTS